MLHIIRWWYHFKTRTLHFLYFIKLWIDWIAFQITPFYLNILSWIWVLKTHIECHVQCPLFRIRCIVNYSFMYEMRMYRFFFYFCRRFFSDISMTKFKMIVRTLNKKIWNIFILWNTTKKWHRKVFLFFFFQIIYQFVFD